MLVISRAEASKLKDKSPELITWLPEATQTDKENTPPLPGPAILSGLAYTRIPEELFVGAVRGVALAIGTSPVLGIGAALGVCVVFGAVLVIVVGDIGAGAGVVGTVPITGVSVDGGGATAIGAVPDTVVSADCSLLIARL